jgi:hypothetical protein
VVQGKQSVQDLHALTRKLRKKRKSSKPSMTSGAGITGYHPHPIKMTEGDGLLRPSNVVPGFPVRFLAGLFWLGTEKNEKD